MPSHARSLLAFSGWLVVLSLPFWLAGGWFHWQPLPGVPVSGLMFICPCAAAVLVVLRREGTDALARWCRQALTWPEHASGAAFAALVLPASALVISYFMMLGMGRPLPEVAMDVHALPWVFAAFLVAATAEQLGWSAYATALAQERYGALAASLVIGLVWAVWHFVPLLQAGRSGTWMAWWTVMTIALRVLQTWLYNSARGSIFAAALCQATANTGWQFFPNHGSHYDPQIAGLVLLGMAAAVVLTVGARLRAEPGSSRPGP